MGQGVSRGTISELIDVTLKGVVPLNKELGRGAYGIVFTVKYKGIVCAAKKIHPILTETASPEEKQGIKDDFIKECLCCSSIRHPNIVNFLGVYYESGPSSLPIMVMELMDISLAKFVENNKCNISFEKKVLILYDVSQALSYLHNRKPPILHRDLSPNNVMLTKQLMAKIGDLGVAKVVRGDNRQTKSKLTTTPGTLHFMPPEALVDNPTYGTPIDIFSFGGIALHVFSEEWPAPSAFKQKDPYTKKMITLTEAERRQQYLDTMTGKAAGLRKMVEQCLHDDPDERPPIREVSTIIEPLKSNAAEILTAFKSTTAHAPIHIQIFSAYVEKLFANDKHGFSEEYKEIDDTSPAHEYVWCHIPVNRHKNRYVNIMCFDHSRVKLIPVDAIEGSDYINANHLPGYTHPREYITCQGPLPETIADFWRMIWEQECPTIIMLTGLVERGKVKCSQYWPDNGSISYGNITVILDGSDQFANYVVRILRVQVPA